MSCHLSRVLTFDNLMGSALIAFTLATGGLLFYTATHEKEKPHEAPKTEVQHCTLDKG